MKTNKPKYSCNQCHRNMKTVKLPVGDDAGTPFYLKTYCCAYPICPNFALLQVPAEYFDTKPNTKPNTKPIKTL